MELRDYFRLLRRRWWVAVSFFLVLSLGWIASVVSSMRPTWTASALIGMKAQTFQAVISELGQDPFSSTGYGYFTREELLKSRRVRAWGAAVLKYSRDADNPDLKQEEKLLSEFEKRGWVDGNTRHVKEDLFKDEISSLASISFDPVSEKVQLVRIATRALEEDEAVRQANAFATGAALFSRVESLRTLQEAEIRLREQQEEFRAKQIEIRKDHRGLDRYDKDMKRLAFLETEVQRHQKEAEHISGEIARERDRLAELGRQKLLRHEGIPREWPTHLTSDLLNRIQGDIVSARTEVTVQGAIRWNPAHPRLEEIKTRIARLEQEAVKEMTRLRDLEMKRIEDGLRGLEGDLVHHQLHGSAKAGEMENLQLLLRGVRPHLDRLRKMEEEERRLADVTAQIKGKQALQQPFFLVEEVARPGNTRRNDPQWRNQVTMGLAVALIAALGVVYLLDMWDNRIYTDYDVRRYLNVTCVGTMETVGGGKSPLLTREQPTSVEAERYTMVGTLLRTYMLEREFRTLAVCSAVQGEGKTTVATNLAVSFARKGLSTVLVDADLRKPQVHETFGISKDPGLSSYLKMPESEWDNIDHVLAETSNENLWLLASGPIRSNPGGLLESPALLELFKHLRDRFDMIVVDTPPITSVGDALTLVTRVDTNLMVIRSGNTDRRLSTWAKQMIGDVRGDLAGVMLNFASPTERSVYNYYSGYYYGREQKSVREA